MKTPEVIDAFVDATKCPLCGEDNRCQNICSDPDQKINCWCKTEKFPQQLLNTVPAAAKNKACICERCLNKTLNP